MQTQTQNARYEVRPCTDDSCSEVRWDLDPIWIGDDLAEARRAAGSDPRPVGIVDGVAQTIDLGDRVVSITTEATTQNHALKTLVAAEQAICDAEIPARLRMEMSLVIGTAFDGGSTGAAAWIECETIAGRGMTRQEWETYVDLCARIDLDAIAIEGKLADGGAA